jgi:hypothetical protein
MHWKTSKMTCRKFVVLAFALAPLLFGCATASRRPEVGTLHHVGLVWLKDPGNLEHRRQILSAAHSFAREIPEVRCLSVGQPPPGTHPYLDTSFDICLIMQFKDKAAMERYAEHPVHQKAAKEVFLPLSQRLLFYDFIAE